MRWLEVFHTCRACFTGVKDVCWGPNRGHIPLTDHGCKHTHKFRTTANLFYTSHRKKKVFMGSKTARPAPAGPLLECAIALYHFSLSDCLTGAVKRNNWSEPAGSCFENCESVVRDIVEETMSTGGSLLSRQLSARAPGQRHQLYIFNPAPCLHPDIWFYTDGRI